MGSAHPPREVVFFWGGGGRWGGTISALKKEVSKSVISGGLVGV